MRQIKYEYMLGLFVCIYSYRHSHEFMLGLFVCIYSYAHIYEYVCMSLYGCGLVKLNVSVELSV